MMTRTWLNPFDTLVLTVPTELGSQIKALLGVKKGNITRLGFDASIHKFLQHGKW